MSFSKRGLNEEREKTSGLKEKNKKNKKTKQIPESKSGPLRLPRGANHACFNWYRYKVDLQICELANK